MFPGGFDLEAAERVCAAEPLAVGALIDTLGRLVEKSIVLCEQDGRRYRMLDTIREYGAEQLVLLGEAPVPADEISADPLTRHEREIADRLVLAKRTVDSHIEHIFGKLGFTSRTQLAAWVSRQNAN